MCRAAACYRRFCTRPLILGRIPAVRHNLLWRGRNDTLLHRCANPQASDEELREALGGVLCRCFAHTRMLKAIRKYADARLHESHKA